MRRLVVWCALVVLISIAVAAYSYAQNNSRSEERVGTTFLGTHATSSAVQGAHGGVLDDSSNGHPRVEIVEIEGTSVRVDIADTPEARGRGLSGRESLAQDAGMLFVFPQDGYHGFWMKDMNFPIDIIWLSGEGRVVDMAESVAPESYPASFQPRVAARYVLEVNAGFAKAHNIAIGDTASLSR